MTQPQKSVSLSKCACATSLYTCPYHYALRQRQNELILAERYSNPTTATINYVHPFRR